MFKKLGNKLSGALKGKGNVKYKIEVQIVQIDGLPDAVKKCRVVMSRASKVAMTVVKDLRNGSAVFKQILTLVGTMSKKGDGEFENKEYSFKVQVPGSGGAEDMITIGKSDIDMADYVDDQLCVQNRTLMMQFKVGSSKPTGSIRMIITTQPMGLASEDGMTEISGISGLTSDAGANRRRDEQDLRGFDKMKQSGSRIRDSDEATSKANQFGKKQPPPKNDEDDEDNDSDNAGFRSGPSRLSSAGKVAGVAGVSAAAGGAAGAFAASSAAARKQPAAAFEDPGGFGKKKAPAPAKKKPVYEDSDEDISPMNSDLEDAPPKAKMGAVATAGVAVGAAGGVMASRGSMPIKSKAEIQDEFLSNKASLLSTGKKPVAGATAAKSVTRPPPASMKHEEDDEEDNRAALFSAPAKKAAPTASKAVAPKRPVDKDDDEEDEESSRAALFSAPAKKAAPAASKAAAPQRPAHDDDDDEEDEVSNRAALFSAPAKKAASSASKPAAAKKPVEEDEDDEDDRRNALFSAPAPRKKPVESAKAAAASKPSRAPPPPPVHDDDDDDYEEEEVSSSAKKGVGRSAAVAVGGAAIGAGATAVVMGTSKRGFSKEDDQMEQLRTQNNELQQQLMASEQREAKLSKQVEDYRTKLDEVDGDPQELFTQMQEMEAQHAAQIAALEAQLRQGGAGREQGNSEDLDQREAAVAEREATVTERETVLAVLEASLASQQAKVAADLAAAKKRVEEANKMADDSILVAVQHQQEKKSMVDEIERLKLMLAEANGSAGADQIVRSSGARGHGDDDLTDGERSSGGGSTTNRAHGRADVAAAAAAGPGLDRLRAQVAQLQQENDELRAQLTSAQAASSDKVEGDAAEEGLEAAAGSGGAAVLPSLIASLEAQLVELKAENAAQKAQIVQLGEADVIIKEWSDYADSLTSEKAALQLKVDELTARDADLKSVQLELEAVQAELGEAQSDRGALRIELDAVQALLLAVRVELEGVQRDRDALRSELDSLRSEHDGLIEQHSALLSREDGKTNAKMEESFTGAAYEDEAEPWGCLGSQPSYLEHHRQLSELEQQQQELQWSNADLRKELEGARSQLEELRSAATVAAVVEAGHALSGPRRDMTVSETELKDLRDQMNLIKSERDDLRVEVDRLMGRLAAAEVLRVAAQAGALPSPSQQMGRRSSGSGSEDDSSSVASDSSVDGVDGALRRPSSIEAYRRHDNETFDDDDDGDSGVETRHDWIRRREEDAAGGGAGDAVGSPHSSLSSSAGVGLTPASAVRGWDSREEALLARIAALEAELVTLKGQDIPLPRSSASAPYHVPKHDDEDPSASCEAEEDVASLQAKIRALVGQQAELRGQLEETSAALMQRPLLPFVPSDVTEFSSEVYPSMAAEEVPNKVANAEASTMLSRSNKEDAVASVAELQEKLALLVAWRAGAEATLMSLQTELQIAKLDRDEALQSAAAATKQAVQVEARAAAAASAASALAAAPTVSNSTEDVRMAEMTRAQNPGKSSKQAAIGGASSRSTVEQLAFLSEQLSTAVAVVFGTRRALAGCLGLISAAHVREESGPESISEDAELDEALMSMKDEALALFHELQRQAKLGSHFESQVAAASLRVEELEDSIAQLQRENMRLVTLNTSRSLPFGGALPASGLLQGRPDPKVYAMSEDDASGGYRYGTEGLAMSAMEQQLELAEREVGDVHALVEQLTGDNARLQREAREAADHLALALSRLEDGGGSGVATLDGQVDDDPDNPAVSKRQAARERAQMQRDLTKMQTENIALAAKVAKLEVMLEDLEGQLEEGSRQQEALEDQLEDTHRQLKLAKDETVGAAAMGALGGAAAASVVSSRSKGSDADYRQELEELQDHVDDLEGQLEKLGKEKADLEAQLARTAVAGAAAVGGVAGDASAAATLSKYNKLKERYKMLEETSQEEIDDLADQLQAAQDRIADLEGQITALQRQPGGRAGSASSTAIEELREENQRIVMQLVQKQMELAQISENETMIRRELARAKEVNLKLAAKMTKLEADTMGRR